MKRLMIIGIFISSFGIAQIDTPLKLYAIYTPSHEVLLKDWFLPSLKDPFELHIEFHQQEGVQGTYKEEGWKKTTIKKVELIIKAVEENMGTIFVFSDVDIQFFKPIQDLVISLMEDQDFIVQKDSPNGRVCSGFFVCRANNKTLALWKDVHRYMKKHQKVSDQGALNACLKKNRHNVIWDFLPDTFFGGGTLTGYRWLPGQKLPISNQIVLHHANWTQGVENKIIQLRYVKNTIQSWGLIHNPRRIQ